MWVAGNASTWGAGCATSAAQPTLTTHKVANAMANHSRSARWGSVNHPALCRKHRGDLVLSPGAQLQSEEQDA
jgi:hypothetical protein